MPNLIISTCGTSILTHNAAPTLMSLLAHTANAAELEIDPTERNAIDECRRYQEEQLKAASVADVRSMSAECNGILGFYGNRWSAGQRDQHILLHSDTYQGSLAAQLIGSCLRKENIAAQELLVQNLNTSDLHDFQKGLKELVRWCETTLTGYRSAGFRIIFNLAGGFKAFQGFMQTLGMFYADESIYIFEGSNQLLRIPRLPVQFDEATVLCVRQNLKLFRRLAISSAAVSLSECENIPDTLLNVVGQTAEFSPWGRLVWERNQKLFYGLEILDPPSDKIVYSPRVREKVEKFSADFKERFNRKMDDLAFYLDGKRKVSLNGLDFKQLKGNHKSKATHEFDLWHDGGAWRGFGRFEQDVFTLEWIGEGLH